MALLAQHKSQNKPAPQTVAPTVPKQVVNEVAKVNAAYNKAEATVSSKIPTLSRISKSGSSFARKHPETAKTIHTAFEKAHAQTEKYGTPAQRQALAGYTYGSYQSLQRRPVKTSAMFAAGLAGGRAITAVSKVGKAFGAGTKAARMAKAAELGIVSVYGVQTTRNIMSAPTPYEAGQRAAYAMYTEIIPMGAGAGIAGLKNAKVPKTKSVAKRAGAKTKRGKITSNSKKAYKAKKASKEYAQLEKIAPRIELDFEALGLKVVKTPTAKKAPILKTPTTSTPKKTRIVKDMGKEFRKEAAALDKKIKSGEAVVVKKPGQQAQVLIQEQKVITKTQAKAVVKEQIKVQQQVQRKINKLESKQLTKTEQVQIKKLKQRNQAVLSVLLASIQTPVKVQKMIKTTEPKQIQENAIDTIQTHITTQKFISQVQEIGNLITQTKVPARTTRATTASKLSFPPVPVLPKITGRDKNKQASKRKIKRKTGLSTTQVKNSVATINSIFGGSK